MKTKTVFYQQQTTDGEQFVVTIIEDSGQYKLTFHIQQLIFLEATVLSRRMRDSMAPTEDKKTKVLMEIIQKYEQMKQQDEATIEKLKSQIR